MTIFSDKEISRLKEAASLLLEAEKTLPVLKTLAWDRSHADSFFASGETIPPTPTYSKIDTQICDEQVSAARALINGSSPVHDWLTRFADVTERTAEMLGAVGTADFYRHSKELYGSPSTPIADGKRTALDLALHLDEILSEFDGTAVQLDPSEKLTADDLKVALEKELPKYFGEHVPDVEVTGKVSAKAAAGSDYIKLRSDAMFSDLDVGQLLQHEALIHIATGFNGRAQPHFPILGESHAGNARTQEGLAVFSEFISG
ncbi:MAG: tyrosine/phenylalanine carboxypeptidase domain-containing protein, partial [Pseudomonadota bacterium]